MDKKFYSKKDWASLQRNDVEPFKKARMFSFREFIHATDCPECEAMDGDYCEKKTVCASRLINFAKNDILKVIASLGRFQNA